MTTTARPRVRVGTVVWGLVALAVALIGLAYALFGWVVDPALTTILILIGAGLTLVIAGIVSSVRSRSHQKENQS